MEKLIKASYELLGLMSYLTAGEPEVRAWTIKRGTSCCSGLLRTTCSHNPTQHSHIVVLTPHFRKPAGNKTIKEPDLRRN